MTSTRIRDRSLKQFVIRGVLHVGIPVALFSFTMVMLKLTRGSPHKFPPLALLVALLCGVLPGGVLGGGLYRLIMWALFRE